MDRKSFADALVTFLGSRSPARLLPYLKDMYPHARVSAAKLFLEHIHEDPCYRKALFDLAADRDGSVHESVFSLLEKINPRAEEISQLEALLTRKTDSLRRGVIGLLLRQPDIDLLATIDRMLAQRDEQQRQAGIELLREMARGGRERGECRARAARLQGEGLSEAEKHILADLLVGENVTYSLSDALGLANLNNLSHSIKPQSKKALFGLVKKIRLGSSAAAACIQALDDLVDQHRTEPVQVNDWRNEARTELLGNARWGLVLPDPGLSLEENRQRFQLAGVWERWYQERPNSQQDPDGLELIRAQAALSLLTGQRSNLGEWTQVVPKELRIYLDEPYDLRLKYDGMIAYVLSWLAYLHPARGSVTFLLNAVEETCYRISQQLVKERPDFSNERWQISPNRLGYIKLARQHRHLHKMEWTNEQHAHFWGLIRWLEQFTWQKGGYHRPVLEDILLGCQVGAATEDDLMMYLLGIPEEKGLEDRLRHLVMNRFQASSNRQQFGEIRQFSGKRPQPIFTEYPFLQQAIERCREQILAIELRRGDLPTAASAPALALRSVPGTVHLVCLLSAAVSKYTFHTNQYASCS
jgi:hypothetical protein